MSADYTQSLQNDFQYWLNKNQSFIKSLDKEWLINCFAYAGEVYRLEKRQNEEFTLQTILKILDILTYTPADSLTYTLAMFSKTDPIIAKEPYIARLHPKLPDLLNKYYQLSRLKISLNEPHFSDDLAKMFFTIGNSPHVTLARLADRLVNLQTCSVFDKSKQQSIAEKSLRLYGPLAQVLNLSYIYSELQNEAFKILHPETYEHISKALHYLQHQYTSQLSDIVNRINSITEQLHAECNLTVRIKKPYSVYKKMKFKFPDLVIDNPIKLIEAMYDIIGIRIIVPNVEDCYSLLSLFQQRLPVLPHTKDYIARPKQNGYQSIHCYYSFDDATTIEIQIRTSEMHEKNEYGDASYFYYKTIDPYSRASHSDNWIKNIVKWQENVQGASIGEIGYFKKHIYTLTPKGEIIKLPSDATVLDFAYAIHEDIGNNALQAFVNGNLVPLDHTLHNGDNVFIKTGKRKTPPIKYLNSVKTPEAQKCITRFKNRL